MTRIQRFISLALSGVLIISGFAIGRWTSPTTVSANEEATAVVTPSPAANAVAASGNENSSFYLSDYKTGYSDGYNASVSGQGTGIANSTRVGYNEGFKEGYANGYQAQHRPAPLQLSAFAKNDEAATGSTRQVNKSYRTVNRTVYYERKPRSSKLKTALTIAAPAALGAGIGGLAGGKKGAGVGALLGGGGGALYHLFKNRD